MPLARDRNMVAGPWNAVVDWCHGSTDKCGLRKRRPASSETYSARRASACANSHPQRRESLRRLGGTTEDGVCKIGSAAFQASI